MRKVCFHKMEKSVKKVIYTESTHTASFTFRLKLISSIYLSLSLSYFSLFQSLIQLFTCLSSYLPLLLPILYRPRLLALNYRAFHSLFHSLDNVKFESITRGNYKPFLCNIFPLDIPIFRHCSTWL